MFDSPRETELSQLVMLKIVKYEKRKNNYSQRGLVRVGIPQGAAH